MKDYLTIIITIVCLCVSICFGDTWTTSTQGQITAQTTTTKVGIGTTSPQGLLQVSQSYVTALAPTGTASTDSTNIQNAINAVTSGGLTGTVNLLSGTYVIHHTITLPNGLQLIGAGMGNTTISFSNATASIILDATSKSSVSIKNLSLASQQTRIHTGINIKQSVYTNVENVSISNMNTGIYISHSFNNFRNISVSSCNTGILLGNASDPTNEWSTANTFSGGEITACLMYGIRCAEAWGNFFSGMCIEAINSAVKYAQN
jgi:hypothetical protein